MALKIISRDGWGAAKPKSRTPRSPSQLAGVALHWFGKPNAADSHEGCPALLRSVQRGHMAGEFADIAYNHAVCPHGAAYELRGFGVQTGANGFGSVNRSHAAIVYMGGIGDPFTNAAKPVINELIAEWQKKGAGTDVKPHGFFTGSECPGPDIRKWIAAGRPEPGVKPKPKPKPADDQKNDTPAWLMDFIEWRLIDDADPKKRPKGVPRKVPPSAWEAATETHHLLNAAPPQEPFLDWAEWRLEGAKKSQRPKSLPAAVPKSWFDALKRIKAMTAKA
jgi:hypothetical protein